MGKATITKKGVYDSKGKRVEVGTDVTFKGDHLPSYLVGKARLVEAAKAKVTNPAEGGVQEADK